MGINYGLGVVMKLGGLGLGYLAPVINENTKVRMGASLVRKL